MKKVFKITTTVLAFCFIMAFSSNTVSASENEILVTKNEVIIEQGYTEDGVYYEVYESSTPITNQSDIAPYSMISIDVSRQVVYYAIMSRSQIPDTIYWSEQYDKYTTVSGYLDYTSIFWEYDNKITRVWYAGTLVGRV